MGSWSESCGFSGIEIGEGEAALVAFLGKPKYAEFNAETHYELRTPLIRGTYNDYGYLTVAEDEGVLALFNHLSGLSLKNGDDFSGCGEHFVKGLDRYWIRQDVFDTLGALKQDFPYFYDRAAQKSVKVKDIGAYTDKHLDVVRGAVAQATEARAKWEELADSLKDLPSGERFRLIKSAGGLHFREAFGYGHSGLDWFSLFNEPPEGITSDALIEAYRRHFLLTYAAVELRKKFVPSEKGGPQHGGEQASCQFARSILAIQKERKKRWDD